MCIYTSFWNQIGSLLVHWPPLSHFSLLDPSVFSCGTESHSTEFTKLPFTCRTVADAAFEAQISQLPRLNFRFRCYVLNLLALFYLDAWVCFRTEDKIQQHYQFTQSAAASACVAKSHQVSFDVSPEDRQCRCDSSPHWQGSYDVFFWGTNLARNSDHQSTPWKSCFSRGDLHKIVWDQVGVHYACR